LYVLPIASATAAADAAGADAECVGASASADGGIGDSAEPRGLHVWTERMQCEKKQVKMQRVVLAKHSSAGLAAATQQRTGPDAQTTLGQTDDAT
jgi:hypothetical protein